MMAAAPGPHPSSPFNQSADLLWTQLPQAVARLSPNLGRAINERAGWLDAVPLLLVLVVPAAVVLGGLIGAFHFNCPAVYSSSLAITASLLAVSCACGAGVGAWLTFGYAAGDFFFYSHPYQIVDTPVNVVGLRLGLIVSYIGLFLLLALVPMTASIARRAVAAKTDNHAVVIAAHITAAAMFAFAWSQSVPLMLRPMFVWAPDPSLGKIPPIGAIHPVQSNGIVFAVVAALFSLGMVLVLNPQADTWSPPPSVLSTTGAAQGYVRAFISGILITLMFSGLVASVTDFVVLYALVQTAALLRLAILPARPGYLHEVEKVPLAIRIILPIFGGAMAGLVLLNLVFAGNDLDRVRISFMPVILALGIGLISSAFTLPAAAPISEQAL